MGSPFEAYMNLGDLCAELQMSRPTVLKFLKQRGIIGQPMGNMMLYPRDILEDFRKFILNAPSHQRGVQPAYQPWAIAKALWFVKSNRDKAEATKAWDGTPHDLQRVQYRDMHLVQDILVIIKELNLVPFRVYVDGGGGYSLIDAQKIGQKFGVTITADDFGK